MEQMKKTYQADFGVFELFRGMYLKNRIGMSNADQFNCYRIHIQNN